MFNYFFPINNLDAFNAHIKNIDACTNDAGRMQDFVLLCRVFLKAQIK